MGTLEPLTPQATFAQVADVLTRMGDPTAHTLSSLTAKFGNSAQTLLEMVGYEGATSLANKLTAARATLIPNLDATIASRAPAATALSDATWTAARAARLDADISSRAAAATALSTATWTTALAAHLDADISSRAVAGDQMALTAAERLIVQALIINDTTPFAGANINAAIDTRAPSATALSTATWTAARAGYLDMLIAGVLQPWTFWSDIEDAITITAGAVDTNLPDIVVAGLPANFTILRVTAGIKIRAIENTNAAANKLNGAQNIVIKDSAAAWGAAIPAINLADDQWAVAANTREMGDVQEGDLNLSATVDANDTYNLRFEDAIADVANLVLNDVAVYLKIWVR